MDDITVRGRTREEHDENLKCFVTEVKKCNITLTKSVPTPPILKLLGYHISNGVLQPDPDRAKPLLELSVPNTGKELPTPCRNICVPRSVRPLLFRKNQAVDCNARVSLARGGCASFKVTEAGFNLS